MLKGFPDALQTVEPKGRIPNSAFGSLCIILTSSSKFLLNLKPEKKKLISINFLLMEAMRRGSR